MSNRWRGSWKVVALAAAVLLAGSGTTQAQKLIRWKFQPGQTLRYAMEQEQSQNVKVGDTPVTMTVTTTITMTQKIDAVDPQGVASVTQTIDRMQMKMSPPPGMTQGLDYDSDSPKAAEGMAALLTPLLDAMVKKPFTMKIDPRGQVSEMKLPAGLVEALNKAGGGQMKGMFNEDALRQMTGQGMAMLAEKAVAQGETWTRDATVDMPTLGAMKIATQYRYEGTEKRDGKELDKITSTMQMDVAPPKDKPLPFQMKIGDQKTEGTIYFDSEAGRIVEMKTQSKMTITVDVPGQKVEQQMTMNQTLRLAPPEKTAEKTP
jgi:hypothetical protein